MRKTIRWTKNANIQEEREKTESSDEKEAQKNPQIKSKDLAKKNIESDFRFR